MFEVQTETLCDGWVNCWAIDDKPQTFATLQEAMDAIKDHIIDQINAVEGGDMEDSQDPAEFRIVSGNEIYEYAKGNYILTRKGV